MIFDMPSHKNQFIAKKSQQFSEMGSVSIDSPLCLLIHREKFQKWNQ